MNSAALSVEAATQDMKVKEEIERLSIEVGKLKEPWEVHDTLKKGGFYDRSGAKI